MGEFIDLVNAVNNTLVSVIQVAETIDDVATNSNGTKDSIRVVSTLINMMSK